MIRQYQKIFFISLSFIVIWSISLAQNQSDNDFKFNETKLDLSDRILILAPHPDDEDLGCAGIIQQALDLKLPLKIVFFTYGDNNEWSFLVYRKRPVFMPKAVEDMGEIRHNEAIKAAQVLGIQPEQLIFLGYPDFKTLNIWYSHWGDSPAVESMLTKAKAVPYTNAFRPGVPYKGEEILKDLETILRGFKPTKIFVSHPGDHNPDHRSLYLFTRVALWDLEKEIKPVIYPYLIHYKLWPKPKGYHPDKPLFPPSEFKQENAWFIYNLKPAELKNKLSAIHKHRSQYISSGGYLVSFIRSNELFGDFSSMTLFLNAPSTKLSFHPKQNFLELPEQLLNNERVSFIGIEQRYIRIEGNELVLNIKLSRPLGKEVGASIYLFGYRHDRPFKEMPKLHIKFGEIEYKIYDQDRRILEGSIKVKRKAKAITINVPLDKLGNPQHILTSAHTYLLGTVPLDWVSWRILEISDGQTQK